ncbi:MAG: MgtC/SapB family protein [Gemmatimonadota bacterium]
MDAVASWFSTFAAAHPELHLDLLGRLILAVVLGGAIGWERERSRKPAGLRTNILICVGAALLTYVGMSMAAAGGGGSDPARIAAQIVSGIGFLGAGTILQSRGSVTGLTTAATMWVVAAIGIAVGSGAYVEAVGASALVLVVLIPLGILEDRYEARAGEETPAP